VEGEREPADREDEGSEDDPHAPEIGSRRLVLNS
jgi:hypothetical protein